MSDPYADPWVFLREKTPARIALGRCGDGLPTARLLEFQRDHARARDAVHAALDSEKLCSELDPLKPIIVQSQARDRALYLQRPDLGRRLDEASREKLREGFYDISLVLADGLSALAVQSQAARLGALIEKRLPLRFAPPVIALQARVALGDEIASALGARLVIVLIGERPGLSAADSLGAYITFAPVPGKTTDAQRNCISNIRPGGLSLEEAARRIGAIASYALHLQGTGTMLKEDAALNALAPPEAMKER
ncbi:ethanolamine ammonia-lyase subunit EutC [Beijerinckia indica]|uniref:Ethanolamine ammonia-lyase small subunit n=1 Tax=Beijerinckia indica subsp. indica (strain ATCC 9039 / DSM 1715 / NCIMB 8712) TaxID=395963 RepID=B2IB25_BEII9|nr:ethanolamine ammonia-lyase subunit EutC [Beijerinckia indica]ACB93725.1 Ethanolamine ammonia-lyase [Beijerinckia indica subsp. indica ATCC 9039]